MVPHPIHPPLARPWHESALSRIHLKFRNRSTAPSRKPYRNPGRKEEAVPISTPRDPDLPETLAQNAARFGMDSRKHLAPKIQALADPEARIKRIHPTAQALGSMRETRPKKTAEGNTEHGTASSRLDRAGSMEPIVQSQAAGSPRKSFFRGAAYDSSSSTSLVPSCSMELRFTTWHVIVSGCTRRCQIGKTASDRGPERHHTEKTLVPWRGMVHAD